MKHVKVFIAGFLVSAMMTTAVFAVAAPTDVSIKAILSNTFKMKIFGKDYIPKEKDGSFVKPLIYKGKLYLPAKTLCESLGVAVDLNMTSKNLWIGGKIQTVPVNDINMYEDYSRTILTKDAEKLTTADTTYKWGIANSKKLSSVYYGCYLKPEAKYKRFTASVFMDGEMKTEMVMEFRKNDRKGEVIKSIVLKPGETTDIDIDIGGVSKMLIFTEVHGTVTNLIVGEPTFRNDTPVTTPEVTTTVN